MFTSHKKKIIAGVLLSSLTFSIAQASSAITLTIEELRIEKATLAIPLVVNKLDNTVNDFSNALSTFEHTDKTASAYNKLTTLIEVHGNNLWKKAYRSFHYHKNLDDRSLYWARLKMTKVLRQSSTFFNLSPQKQTELLWAFELSSRGNRDISFDQKTDNKILLLGFDPFLLDRNIEQNNPSGVTSLAFDNLHIEYKGTTAEIETLIVPVRFADFDQGMIETLLTPFLKSNSVDMILTVSMGREDFDLERFPGLRRSVTAPDNLNIKTGANPKNPLIPMLKGEPLDGKEFIEFSLPA